MAGARFNSASVKKNLRSLNMPERIMAGLNVEVEIEVTEVKKRTPVRWYPKGKSGPAGALRASVHQEGPFRKGRSVYSMIVAGGPAAPYAIYVHEDLTAFHHVGEAKFIESVINESRPFMAARVARRIAF